MALLLLLFFLFKFVACLKVGGAGYSYTFQAPGYGLADEIRSSIYPNGMDSFTLSLWSRNILPNPESQGVTFGYQGGVLSYYSLYPPSAASTTLGNWAFNDGMVTDNLEPENMIFHIADYSDGTYINLFEYSFEVYADAGSVTPFQFLASDTKAWYQSIVTWNNVSSTMTFYGFATKDGQKISFLQDYTVPLMEQASLPPGVWRLGQTSNYDPNLALEVDNFCVFDTALNASEVNSLNINGCNSPEISKFLSTYYTFDNDREMVPNLYNSADGTYSGISTNKLTLTETCNAGLILPQIIGPYTTISNAPVFNGHINIISTSDNLQNYFPNITCLENCAYIKVLFLPSFMDVCSSNLQSSCLNSSQISSAPNYTVNFNGFVNIWINARNIQSNVGDTRNNVDSANIQLLLQAWNTGNTESANITVTVKRSFPAVIIDGTLSMPEGTLQVIYIPQKVSYITNPDGNLGSYEAVITSFSRSISDENSFHIYDCPVCLNNVTISANNNLLISCAQSLGTDVLKGLPYTVTDPLRRVLLLDIVNNTVAENALYELNFTLSNGFSESIPSIISISVISGNQAPRAFPMTISAKEDDPIVLYDLSTVSIDREHDYILYSISKFPQNFILHQAIYDSTSSTPNIPTKGALITKDSNKVLFDQWVSGTLMLSECGSKPGINWTPDDLIYPNERCANSCWKSTQCVLSVVGPPDLWPKACDCPNVWGPDINSGLNDGWLEVYFDTPVYPSSVTVFMTWAPGSIVRIQAKPYDEHLYGSEWLNIWQGAQTTFAYCITQQISAPCAARILYPLWSTIFRTNHLRFSFQLISSSQYQAVDAISLEGAINPSSNIILNSKGHFFMQSRQHFFGKDELIFDTTDLSYYLEWESLPVQSISRGLISMNVDSVVLPPVSFSSASNVVNVLPNNYTLINEIGGYDVNGLEVSMTITNLPTNGNLYFVNLNSGIQSSPSGTILFNSTLNAFYFEPNTCFYLATQLSPVTFVLSNLDAKGNAILSVTSTLTLSVSCTVDNLEVISVDSSTSIIAVSVIGVLAFSFQGFVAAIVYKHRASVLISSIKQKFCYILIFASFVGQLGTFMFVIPVSRASCALQVIFISLSFAINMGTMVSTARRIFAILGNPNNMKRIKYDDARVMKLILAIVGVDFVYLVLGIAIGAFGGVQKTLESTSKGQYFVNVCYYNAYYFSFQILFVLGTIGYTIFLSWKVINTPSSFNESKHLFNTAVIEFVIGIIVIPTSILIGNNSQASNFLLGTGLGFGALLIMVSMFMPKLILIFHDQHNNTDLLMQRTLDSGAVRIGSMVPEDKKSQSSNDRVSSSKPASGESKRKSVSQIVPEDSRSFVSNSSEGIIKKIDKKNDKIDSIKLDEVICAVCDLTYRVFVEDVHNIHRQSENHKLKVSNKMNSKKIKRLEKESSISDGDESFGAARKSYIIQDFSETNQVEKKNNSRIEGIE